MFLNALIIILGEETACLSVVSLRPKAVVVFGSENVRVKYILISLLKGFLSLIWVCILILCVRRIFWYYIQLLIRVLTTIVCYKFFVCVFFFYWPLYAIYLAESDIYLNSVPWTQYYLNIFQILIVRSL